MRDAVPLKRLATEAEISAAICFLLSEASAFTTGVTLPIDGSAPMATVMWPMPDHERSTPYEGFHRATTPGVLRREPTAASQPRSEPVAVRLVETSRAVPVSEVRR